MNAGRRLAAAQILSPATSSSATGGNNMKGVLFGERTCPQLTGWQVNGLSIKRDLTVRFRLLPTSPQPPAHQASPGVR